MQAPLVAGSLPLAYCWPSNPQQFANDLFSISYANVADNVTGVVYGSTNPGSGFKLWFHSGRGRLYEFNDGIWRSLYPWPADPGIKQWVELTEPQIAALHNDGAGINLVAGAETITGPFWAIDHNYDGRSPMGVGAIPGTTPGKTMALGGVAGEGDHLQLVTELVQHTHKVEFSDAAPGGTYAHVNTGDAHPFDGSVDEPIGLDAAGVNLANMMAMAAATPAVPGNITHPVRGGYWIKRTARVYFTL
jgi:hypothetical protein